jgi:hydrocephalus-inducing protein
MQGIATRADAENHIEASTPSKKLLVQELVVKNWLNNYQRFQVVVEHDSKDNSVRVDGPPTLDIPPLVERKYKLSFFALKTGFTRVTVRMTNTSTNEKLFYTLGVTSTESVEDSSIPPLQTSVRQRVTYMIPIRNPLAEVATFNEFHCVDAGIRVALPVHIHPQEQGHLELQYCPLLVSESKEPEECTLQLISPQLGTFVYRLVLTAKPSSTDSDLVLRTFLGSETMGTFRFLSFAPKDTTYECAVESSEYNVDSNLRVLAGANPPGGEGVPVSVEVRFEPSAVGDSRAMLRVTSPTGGEYHCLLKGFCDPPKPQGPYIIPAGGFNIRFRNVLDTVESFSLAVDNPVFILGMKEKVIRINPKSTIDIKLQYKPEGDAKANPKGKQKEKEKVVEKSSEPNSLGKLLVMCPALPGITWVYYLSGR